MKKKHFYLLFFITFIAILFAACKKEEATVVDTTDTVLVVTDTKAPVVTLSSPVYGAILAKNKLYTLKGTASDDVEIAQIVVQIRQKNTNIYVLDKVITPPAGTKGYNIVENFTTPTFAGQRYYTASITVTDKTNKKTATSVEISIN